MEEGVPIESRMITRRIEAAQKAVEGQNFRIPQTPPRIRRRNEQAARRRLWFAASPARRLGPEDLIIEDSFPALGDLLQQYCPEKAHVDDWDLKGLKEAVSPSSASTSTPKPQAEDMNRQELGGTQFSKSSRSATTPKEKLIGALSNAHHAHHHAQRDRRAMERSPPQHGSLKEGIGPARLRASMIRCWSTSASLRHVRRDGCALSRKRRPHPLPDADSGTPADSSAMPGGHPEGRFWPGFDATGSSLITGGRGGTDALHAKSQRLLTISKKAFQRKKKRELEQAVWPAQAICKPSSRSFAPEKSGRNDPCPAAAAKKYKKSAAAGAVALIKIFKAWDNFLRNCLLAKRRICFLGETKGKQLPVCS